MGDRSETSARYIAGTAFIPVLVGLFLGVALYYANSQWWLVLVVTFFAVWVLQRFNLCNRKVLFVCILVGAGVGLGISALFEIRHTAISLRDKEKITGTFRILSGSERGPGKEFQYVLRSVPRTLHARFLVRTHEKLSVDSCLNITGTFREPKPFDTEYGRTFEYDRYLWARKIAGSLEVEKQEAAACRHTLQGSISRGFFALSQKIEQKIRALFPPIISGFGEGLLLGNKSALPDSVTEDVRRAGLSHIVVLSGFNIVLVMGIARDLASWLFGYRGRRIFALFFGWGLVILSGSEAPAMRAGIMASAMLLGELSSRQNQGMRALLLTAGILVVMNPRILLFDMSFQLSFLATLGLTVIAPIIATKTEWLWKFIRDPFSETVGSSILVFPLIAYQIGALPLYGIFANILAVPLVAYGTMAALVTLAVGFIIPALGQVVAIPVSFLLSIPLWIAGFFGRLPGALVLVPEFSAVVLVGVYGVFWVFFIVYLKKQGISEQKGLHNQ